MRPTILCITILCGTLALPGQIPDFTPPTKLFHAIGQSDAAAVKKMLAAGANPNEGQFFGSSPLLIALLASNPALVQDLLDNGADPKATDRHGSTTLMLAAGAETPGRGIIAQLLSRGVDPNAQNKLGETALTWAIRRGDIRSIEQLKAAGASDAALIRDAVEKSVALLQKSGPQFVKVSGCVSCHHQSLPQMVYAAARDRGFRVDPAITAQQTKAVMAMFRPIREILEKGTITLPNPGISVGYSLLGVAAAGYAPDETTAAMITAIERTQMPGGSFGALSGARPPMEASAFTATALSIRALQIYGVAPGPRINQARQWLQQAKPANQEERSMRLLGLVWAKAEPAAIEKAAADLLAEQRPGGGWAQLANLESDAYATGQALYALYQAPGVAERNQPAMQAGIAYLLRTQFADGSWLVRTRSSPFQPLKDSGFPHGRDQWISAAGTSWAALALSCSQPPVKPEPAVSAATEPAAGR